ncbi:MAG: hypothetical protein AAFR37_12670, partial [Cyanobacteria bacterium J06628_3]
MTYQSKWDRPIVLHHINFDDLIRFFVGWVERSETQHPDVIAIIATNQPTQPTANSQFSQITLSVSSVIN